MQTITSMQNPQVVLWRSLKTRSARQEAGLFLVERVKMVGEALSLPHRLTSLLVDLERAADFEEWTAQAACPVYAVSAHILSAVCDTKTPQGIAALIELPNPPALASLGLLVIAMDGVQDPGNVGTILRTADAAGFSGAILSTACADPYSPKCLRATMGSIFRMPLIVCSDLPEALSSLKSEGYALLSSELGGTPFYERSREKGPQCLIIGSEGNGVSPQVSALATHRLALPMRGGAESLNAAIAAGIMMYDMTNRS